jgi:transcriptional regulator with GAF, ATPase, and Fis domain
MDRDIFREVTVRVCGTLNLGQALVRAFELLQELVPLDEIRVNILDRELHAVKTIAVVNHHGAKDMLRDPLVLPISAAVEEELAGQALADVRTVGRIDEDRATSEVRDEYFADTPPSSLLIMRLVLDGRRQGALILRAVGRDRYGDEHKRLMGALNAPFAIALNNALTHFEVDKLRRILAEENRYLSGEIRAANRQIVGAEYGLAAVMDSVSRVAPLNSPVLLLGETGVGKELVADALHSSSTRRDGPFIKLNCGAIPQALVDSELFGHEKGAFTGAVEQKPGRFERAAGGTLFLDEIGELPVEAQVRLLRVLQTGEFERVGASRTLRADVRIVAATHRDLADLVRRRRFREDLWYRLNVFPIVIPPLRARKADIPALAHHFVEKKSREIGLYPSPPLASDAMDRLRAYDWPGNVRELENVIERALIISRGRPLRFENLGVPDGAVPKASGGKAERSEARPERLDEAMARHIRRALEYTRGRVGGPEGAARLLGVNASTLRNRMKRLGIPYGRREEPR